MEAPLRITQRIRITHHSNSLNLLDNSDFRLYTTVMLMSLTFVSFLGLSVISKAPTSEERDLYHYALKALREDRWDDGILLMESFVHQFPTSEFADNAIYWIAQAYLQKNETGLARVELERIIKDYPRGDRAKRALARLQALESHSTTMDPLEAPKP